MNKPTGAVLWRGLSRYNEKPIALVVTGINPAKPSQNSKTGPVLQGHVLPVRVSPFQAVKTGYDAAVCGGCALRPLAPKSRAKDVAGVCYVQTENGPTQVYKGLQRGLYPDMAIADLNPGKMFRHGAWGDSASLPNKITLAINRFFHRTVGYTHNWRNRPGLRGSLMASVESAAQALEARRRGWRWFRIITEGEELLPGEVLCPNLTHGTQCIDCGICDGADGKCPLSIAVFVHGNGKGRFERMQNAK